MNAMSHSNVSNNSMGGIFAKVLSGFSQQVDNQRNANRTKTSDIINLPTNNPVLSQTQNTKINVDNIVKFKA